MWLRYGNTSGQWRNVWDVSEMTWKFLLKNTNNIKPNNMPGRLEQWSQLAIGEVCNCLVCLIKCLYEIAGWEAEDKIKIRKAEIVQQLLWFPFVFFITFSIIIRQWGPKYFYLLKYLEVVIFIDGWILVYRKLVTGEKKTSHS